MDRKKSRLFIQSTLEKIMSKHSPDDSTRVYYNPDRNTTLEYPCIVYSESRYNDRRADNIRYFTSISYRVTVMDKDRDSSIHMDILDEFDHASFESNYTSDGVTHNIVTINNWRTN